jgi:hypothetical protein
MNPIKKLTSSIKSSLEIKKQKDGISILDRIKYEVNKDLKQVQNDYAKSIESGKTYLWHTLIIGVLLTVIYFILEFTEIKFQLKEIAVQLSLIVGITFIANFSASFFENINAKKKYADFFKNIKRNLIDKIVTMNNIPLNNLLCNITEKDLQSIVTSGFKRIHSNRDDIIPILIDYLKKKGSKVLRVISYDGLEELRQHFDKNKMNEFINNGLVLRILLANHSHFHWIQQKIDMQTVNNGKKEYDVQPLNNNYEEEIKSDKNWVKSINDMQRKEKITIKYHNSLPSNYCIISDDRLFISGKMIGDGKISYSPIYEYINNGNDESIYIKYLNYFDLIWKDEDLSSKYMEIKLTPKLLINNEIINKILQNTCTTMTAILRTIDKDSKVLDQRADLIRAFLTVVNYGEPITAKDESGNDRKLMRRYNTNVVSRYDTINLGKCNNLIDKLGYPITKSHAIGSTILSGEYFFKKINPEKEPQDVENFKSCASLVLPIIGQKEENIFYIEEWNYKKDNSHTIENISETNISGNIKESKSKVIATVTFEFGEEIESHIISIPKESQNVCGYDKDIIEFNDKNDNYFKIEIQDKNTEKTETKIIKSELSTSRLKDEAERCRVLICTYLGLDNPTNMRVGEKN